VLFHEDIFFVFSGGLKKYKPIESETVAKALLELHKKKTKGFSIYESDEIQQIGTNKEYKTCSPRRTGFCTFNLF
jgi:hypothetical protein